MIVPKPKHPWEFGMVIDCRYANSQVHPMAGSLPILGVSMSYLEGAFKSFWQFWPESECQEIYSSLTECEVYCPTRLIQGSTDSAYAFQAGMMEIFDGMVNVSLLIWIDDVLRFSKTFEDYPQVLRQAFERLRKFNVKLNPNKTDLCSREITCRGRKISGAGIRFDGSRIQALLQLPKPTTAD
jgi:hypothetical protein